MENNLKNFWESKVFWINVLAIIGFVVQYFVTDFVISPAIQASALAVINMILRFITKKEIVWNIETTMIKMELKRKQNK